MDVNFFHVMAAMENLRSIGVFVRTIEVGSFAHAATTLGLTPSAVSKSISALERALSVRLLIRSPRGISATVEGARFYDQCRTIVAALERAEREVSQAKAMARGRLRVALHVTPARFRILPALPHFAAEHPDVQLEVIILPGAKSIESEGIDVGVFIGDPPQSNLVARRIADQQFVTCASRSYLAHYGLPRHPSDLLHHRCNIYLRPDGKLQDEWWDGEVVDVRVRGNVAVNDGEALVNLAAAGSGITQVIRMTAEPQLAAGAVVQILSDWRSEAPPIHVLYAKGTTQSARVRAFVDFVSRLFEDLPATRVPRKHWPMRRG